MDKNSLSVTDSRLSLKSAESADVELLKDWFSTEDSVQLWAGANFRFSSLAINSYIRLTKGNYASFCLMQNGTMIGFGQFQIHQGLVHLARLAIGPKYRGKGLISRLIDLLISRALEEGSFTRVTLYVDKANSSAKQAYFKKGFILAPLPKNSKFGKSCDFMTMAYP